MSLQPAAESGCRRLLPAAAREEGRLQAARERVQADSAEARWARGPQLELPVQPALKDLGIAQGLGKEGKNLQAARAKTASDRLRWVARLGVPRQALCRLAGSSALVAGMSGPACHVYDRDMLKKTLWRWVTFAL